MLRTPRYEANASEGNFEFLAASSTAIDHAAHSHNRNKESHYSSNMESSLSSFCEYYTGVIGENVACNIRKYV